MKFVIALLFCASVALGQTNGTVSNDTVSSDTSIPIEMALIMQVQQEQQMSRAYIETLLKLQHSQLSIQASNMFSAVLSLSTHLDQDADEYSDSSDVAFLETESPYGPFAPSGYAYGGENAYGSYGAAPSYNLGYGGFPQYGQQQPSGLEGLAGLGVDSVYKARLLGSFQLYYALKMKFYQAVYRSADVQNEFWQDRAMQLYVQSAGESIPPQMIQLLFVKLYRTNLETLKISLTFQYLSNFVTWLEDEMDVNGSGLEQNAYLQTYIEKDSADDLIRDRMFAFTSYNSFAQIDFQTFYFDLYLESVMGGGSLGGSMPAGGSSFLEEESTSKPFTDIMATGSFGAGVSTAPYMFLKVYRFYFLLFQMYAANSGLSSAYADHQSYKMLSDGTTLNDEDGVKFGQTAYEMLFGGFANNLRYCAQMEYVSALYEMYLLFAPVLAGSLGGSLGSMGSMGSL